MSKVMRFGLVCVCTLAIVSAEAEAAGHGTNKTFVRNATGQVCFIGVDDGGRGLKGEMREMEGTKAYRADPTVTLCADETNMFDVVTVRIFSAEGKCLTVKELKYVPIFGDTNKWRWNGSGLVPD